MTAQASQLYRVFFTGLFLESVGQWAEVFRLIGIARHSSGWPEIACFRRKPFGFLLQCETNDINGTLQIKQRRVQNEVVQMRILWFLMVLHLKMPRPVMIFQVDARLGCVLI